MEQNNNIEVCSLPEIQSIVGYLQNMEFKRKLFGGCDEDNVMEHIHHVTLQYQSVCSNLYAMYRQAEWERTQMQDKLTHIEQEAATYFQGCCQWKQRFEENIAYLQAQNWQLQQQLTAQWTEMEQARQAYYYAA